MKSWWQNCTTKTLKLHNHAVMRMHYKGLCDRNLNAFMQKHEFALQCFIPVFHSTVSL